MILKNADSRERDIEELERLPPYNKTSPPSLGKTEATPRSPKIESGKVLRMRQFADYQFLRQKPVGEYNWTRGGGTAVLTLLM